MSRAFLIFAIVNLSFCVVAHLLTFVPTPLMVMAFLRLLYITSIAACGTAVMSAIMMKRRLHSRAEEGKLEERSTESERSREFRSRLFSLVPKPLKIALIIAFSYCILNVFIAMNQVKGAPTNKDGKYSFVSDGRKIRDLSQEEYDDIKRRDLRGLSSGWMFFSLVPIAYCVAVRSGLEESFQSVNNSQN